MNKIIKNCFNVIFIICFGYILYNAIFKNGVNLFSWNKLSIIIGVIVYILFLLACYKFISTRKTINTKVMLPIILLFVFIFQIYVGELFKVSPNWDMKTIFDNAELYLKGELDNLNYLYTYNNNIGIQIIIILLFKISDLIKVIGHYNIGILFNIIMIDLSLVFTYLVAKKLFNNKKALMIFIMIASMTPIYLYASIVYTDTISMLFPVLIFYLYLLLKERKPKKERIILSILTGIIIFLGSTIKVTILIMPIAILLYELFASKNKKKFVFYVFVITVSILITSVLWILTVRIIFNNWDSNDYKKFNFPLTHWIMMGLNDGGQYREEDVEFTSSFKTKQEKTENNLKIINRRKRWQNMNSIRRKLMCTWGDGTYYAVNTLDFDPINNGIHQEFIFKRGEHHTFYQYYTQIQHISIITLMIIVSLFAIKKPEKNETILRLSIFGLFLFLLIWETRSRYLVNYLPVMQIISFIGIEYIYKSFNKIKVKNK